MSVTTETLLQTLNDTLVTNAPVTWPTALSTANMTIALVRPGEGSGRMVAGQLHETRIYETIVLVAEAGQKTLPTAKATISALIPAFLSAYTDPDNKVLQGAVTAIIINSEQEDGLTDTGFTEIEDFYGKTWYGFILNVTISEFPRSA